MNEQHLLELAEDQANAANDEIRGGLTRFYRKKLDRKRSRVGAEDEAAVVEVDVAELKSGAAAYGVQVSLARSVESERGVVAIKNDDRLGSEERLHGRSLLGVCADSNEATPELLGRRAPAAVFVKQRGGDGYGFENGVGQDQFGVPRDGGGDEGNEFDLVFLLAGERGCRGMQVDDVRRFGAAGVEYLGDCEVLCSEDSVETFEGEGSFAVEEV